MYSHKNRSVTIEDDVGEHAVMIDRPEINGIRARTAPYCDVAESGELHGRETAPADGVIDGGNAIAGCLWRNARYRSCRRDQGSS